MIIERDVLIPTRHGDPVAVDVFRPEGTEPVPVIATMSPYGKDIHWPERYPLYEQADQGPEAVWETPYPEWWVSRGYAVLRADSPGTGKSPGRIDLLGEQEVDGYVDTIEWAGRQEWSTGKVGALGISWLAMLQWHAAAQRPPHLAAIIPWEGSSDLYREFARHGGILDNAFTEFWWDKQIAPQRYDAGAPTTTQTDPGDVILLDAMREHPFLDDWYAQRTPDLSKIAVPLLTSGNWGSLVLHQRGVIEAFTAADSEFKQLVITSGTHIGPFYEDWAKSRQLRFFDRWLKDELNGAENDPPVHLAIRTGDSFAWRDENEWPLARTRWARLHLDALSHDLTWTAPGSATLLPFDPMSEGAEFSILVEEDLEVTGPVAMRLWVSSAAEDLDVFVRLSHLGPDGHEYFGIGPQGSPMPMAMGWLRASHRELDEERSLPHRPLHTHRRRLPLTPSEPTALDIEIWPTSIVIPAGHRLVVRIRGNDDDMGLFAHNDSSDRPAAIFGAPAALHTGGAHDSFLTLPVIPARVEDAASSQ